MFGIIIFILNYFITNSFHNNCLHFIIFKIKHTTQIIINTEMGKIVGLYFVLGAIIDNNVYLCSIAYVQHSLLNQIGLMWEGHGFGIFLKVILFTNSILLFIASKIL